MLDFIGYTLAAVGIIARVAAYFAGPATFVLIILALVGVVGWSLVLTVFLAGIAATILALVALVSADAILG